MRKKYNFAISLNALFLHKTNHCLWSWLRTINIFRILRVLASFWIVLEFLIYFRNSSGLLMHKICDFRNAELTLLSEKKNFSRVLGRFSMVLEFLTLFRNSSGKLQKIWLLKMSTIFFKISFSRIPRILFRVMDWSPWMGEWNKP